MENNKAIPERRKLLRRIFFVLFAVVMLGGSFAFHDYIRQFNADTQSERRLASAMIKDDTRATIARRFMIGGTFGAILGILIVIQSMRRKKRDDDTA